MQCNGKQWNGHCLMAHGKGTSKKMATQKCAENALAILRDYNVWI
jgi:dsRNA-specific ribonuclease